MAKKTIGEVFKQLQAAIGKAVDAKQMRYISEFAANLIIKRTRLGYGVKTSLGTRAPLKPLSKRYVEQRRRSNLSALTAPKKSNLTFTGEMLESVSVTRASKGKLVIGPTGGSAGRPNNAKLTEYNAERGRIYLNISRLEFNQILSEYRKQFSDLLVRAKLIR